MTRYLLIRATDAQGSFPMILREDQDLPNEPGLKLETLRVCETREEALKAADEVFSRRR